MSVTNVTPHNEVAFTCSIRQKLWEGFEIYNRLGMVPTNQGQHIKVLLVNIDM